MIAPERLALFRKEVAIGQAMGRPDWCWVLLTNGELAELLAHHDRAAARDTEAAMAAAAAIGMALGNIR